MRQRLEQHSATIILVVSLAAVFHRFFLGEVIYWGTPILQFYPWQKFAFDAIRAGSFPLWNPLLGNGAPLLANYQSAVLYPPNWVQLVIPTEYAMGWLGLAHLIWAGLGMIRYLTGIGVDRASQGIGAVAFALSGYLLSRFGFLSITYTVAWLPWLMWAADRLMQPASRPTRTLRLIAALALVMAMQLLAGHAQTTFYSVVLTTSYGIWRWMASPSRRVGLKRLLSVMSGLALGAGMASMQILPTFELMQNSQRASGVEREFGLQYSYWPFRFITLLVPSFFGNPATGDFEGAGNYWEDATYVGLLTLILVCHAVLRWTKERQSRQISRPAPVAPFFAATAIIAFVFALGKASPIFVWLFDHNVPGFSSFQAPTRWTILAEFALCVLAAVGIDGLRATRWTIYWTRLLTAAGAAIILMTLSVGLFAGDIVHPNWVAGLTALGAATLLAGVWILIYPKIEGNSVWLAWWRTAAIVIVALDLGFAHQGLTPTISGDYYRQPSALAKLVSTETRGYRTFYFTADEDQIKLVESFSANDFRADDRPHWDTVRSALIPNMGMLDGVASANNFEPLRPYRYEQAIQRINLATSHDVQLALLQKMNVSVVLAPSQLDWLEPIGRVGPVYAHRVPDPWPLYTLADCDTASQECVRLRASDGKVAVVSDQPIRVQLSVAASAPSYLVASSTYYPGWKASVDGKTAAIVMVGEIFQAVPVPAGSHEVVLSYAPTSLLAGVIVSIASGLITASLWAIPVMQRTPAAVVGWNKNGGRL